MSTFNLLRAELWHRKLNVLLSLTALIAAATLFVASPTLLEGYQQDHVQAHEDDQDDRDQPAQQLEDPREASDALLASPLLHRIRLACVHVHCVTSKVISLLSSYRRGGHNASSDWSPPTVQSDAVRLYGAGCDQRAI